MASLKTYLIASALLISSAVAATTPWGYNKDNGPATWPHTYPACKPGGFQTPIDIPAKGITSRKLAPIHFYFLSKPQNKVNNGHTIQINFNDKSLAHVTIGNQVFHIVQFHFHSLSETTWQHKHKAMELHWVLRNVKNQKLAVVAVMIEPGRANRALNAIFKTIPAKQRQLPWGKTSAKVLNALLPNNKTYIRFQGSLTTPPCTAGVMWYVMKNPITASKAQIKDFRSYYSNNYRPTQPLNNRLLIQSR